MLRKFYKTFQHFGPLALLFLPLFIRGQSCPGLGSVSVNLLAEPQPTLNYNPEICAGGSTTIGVGQVFSSYNWSTGSVAPSISVSNGGNYTVTVTNAAGCTATTEATITVNAAPPPNIVANPYACNGTLTLDAGSGYAAYNWSAGGGANETATYSSPGTYTVTVTNSNGCTSTDNFNVTIPPPPVVSVAAPATICDGAGAIITATAGFAGYEWSIGGNSSSVGINQGGTYTVTVTNNAGCTATSSATVQLLPFNQPDLNAPMVVCPGNSFVISVNGGPYSNYQWTGGQSSPTFSGSNAGTYTVTVTASNGCSGSASAFIAPGGSTATTVSGDLLLCASEATTLATSGVFSNYSWSNGGSGPSITINSTGSFTVTVTNSNGCTGTAAAVVSAAPVPVVAVTGNTQICPGTSTSLNATAGFTNYFWSTSQTSAGITVSMPGNYSVLATDVNGCTASADIAVSALLNPTPAIAGPGSICPGGNATFTVAGSFSAYQWSTGTSGPSINVVNPGTYTVTVTATNGCTGTDTQNLTITNFLSPQIAIAPYNCNGQITLDAGAGFTSYNWSGGATTQTITVSNSSDYTVTVTDGTGCTGTTVATASIPAPPVMTVTGNTSFCQGTSNTLSATAGLNGYIWSNGQGGPSISVLQAGLYAVTAFDSYGCQVNSSITVNTLPPPPAQITGPAVICVNSSGTLTASGGVSYLWNSGETTAAITVSSGGTFTVVTTDNAGCTNTAAVNVTLATSLEPAIAALPYQCNGTFDLNAGTGFNTYQWSGGQTTAQLNVSQSGLYTVTVTDAAGCTGTDEFQADIPVVSTVAISGITSFCTATSTNISATAGFASYQWSSGASVPDIVVTQAGNYTVTVTDQIGCTAVNTATVTAIPLPVPAITGPVAICQGQTATLGTNQNYTSYLWSEGSTTATIVPAGAGMFTVTVTDSNGCTGTDQTDFVVNPVPSTQITQAPYACNGMITLMAETGFTNYVWSNGGGTSSVNIAVSGDFTVTVTDNNGCTTTAISSVIVPQLPVVSISAPAGLCPGTTTMISASNGFASYQWSSGDTGNIISGGSGTYSVTATDLSGCTTSTGVQIAQLPIPSVSINAPASICGNNPVQLSVSGTYNSILWSGGENQQSVTINQPGQYTVTVSDAAGCTNTAQTTVVAATLPQPSITISPYQCDGQLQFSAGTGFEVYQWSNGANTPDVSVGQNGNFTVTVTDNNGCTGTATANAVIPQQPQTAISGTAQICLGNTSILTAASTGMVAFAWSTGGTSSTETVSAAGNYTVTVTDANNCTATAGFTLAVLPNPTTSIAVQPKDCAGTMSVDAGAGFATYLWNNNQTSQTLQVTAAGNYTVTVTSADGCTGTAAALVNIVRSDTTFQTVLSCNPDSTGIQYKIFNAANGCDSVLVINTLLQTSTLSGTIAQTGTVNGTELPCAGSSDGTATVSPSSGILPFSYQWSNGAVNNPVAQQLAAGIYTVTFTDAEGCTGTASVTFTEPLPLVPDLLVKNPDCFSPGEMQLKNITGGTGPFMVKFGMVNTTTDGSAPLNFTGPEDAGTLTLEITDARGCTFSQNTAFGAPAGINQFVEDTIQIKPGESVQLQTGGITIAPQSITWTPAQTLSCNNCLAPFASPVLTTLYELEVSGATNCAAAGRFLVVVQATRHHVFAPNVINPFDPSNNGFTIFGDATLLNIKSLQVYDRWGGKITILSNILPNDPQAGWDGQYRGKPAEPGVYTFWAEVEYDDGSTEILKGDITVIR